MMKSLRKGGLFIILSLIRYCSVNSLSMKESDKDVNIVAIIEAADATIAANMKKTFADKGTASGLNYVINVEILEEGKETPAYLNVCKALQTGVSIVLDFTWRGFGPVADACFRLGVPYQRIDTTTRQFVQAADNYVENRNITDAVLIFPNENELHQGLHYLIGNSIIRVLVLSNLDAGTAKNLTKLKPAPSNYIAFGSGSNIQQMIQIAESNQLIKDDSKWILVYEDFNDVKPSLSNQKATVTYIKPNKQLCCKFLSKTGSPCSCNSLINQDFVNLSFEFIANVFDTIKKSNSKIISIVHDCNDKTTVKTPLTNANATYKTMMESKLSSYNYIDNQQNILRVKLDMNIETGGKSPEKVIK